MLMGLHYLMFVQSPPVIPCLHNLSSAICVSVDCNNNQKKIIDGNIVRYHDCVRIVNKMTHLYDSKTTSEENKTIWYGENTKNVGDLVLELFHWMSQVTNLLRPMSLKTTGRINRLHVWRKHDAILPDPFVSTKNTA